VKGLLRAIYRKTIGRRKYLVHYLKTFPSRILPSSTLVDVGASNFFHAKWSQMLHSPSVTWIAIDPSEESLQYCRESSNYSAKIFALGGVAIAGVAGKYSLNITNVQTGASLLPVEFPDHPRLAARFPRDYFYPVTTKEILCKSLEDAINPYIKKTTKENYVWLKLDIQGLELEVLKSYLTSGNASCVVVIESECSLLAQDRTLYKGATEISRLKMLLESLGFEMVMLEDANKSFSDSRSLPVEADVCFMMLPEVALSKTFQCNIELICAYICYDLYAEARAHIDAVVGEFAGDLENECLELTNLASGIDEFLSFDGR